MFLLLVLQFTTVAGDIICALSSEEVRDITITRASAAAAAEDTLCAFSSEEVKDINATRASAAAAAEDIICALSSTDDRDIRALSSTDVSDIICATDSNEDVDISNICASTPMSEDIIPIECIPATAVAGDIRCYYYLGSSFLRMLEKFVELIYP